LVISVRAAIV